MQLIAATIATPALAQTTTTSKATYFATEAKSETQALSESARSFADAIIAGFLRNAEATSKEFVVCDYPGGTKLKSCCTPSGKTYVSVARMLPVLVESADRRHRAVLVSVFAHAFDPQHPDFWGY